MTYDEFQQHLGKAGLSITEFADLVKMNKTSLYNCAKKDAIPSHLAVIAVLLNEMSMHGIDCREALMKVEATPKKPRGAGVGKFGGKTSQSNNKKIN